MEGGVSGGAQRPSKKSDFRIEKSESDIIRLWFVPARASYSMLFCYPSNFLGLV